MCPKPSLHLLVITLLLITTCGCDRQVRYKVLTFFFTGVPPVEEYYSDVGHAEKRPIAAAEENLAAVYSHPLLAARQCTACHKANVQGSSPTSKHYTSDNIDAGETMVTGLKMPPERLCVTCHLDKTPRRAIRERLWLHTPVASGECLSCHDEHQSSNPTVLRQNSLEICLSCHTHKQISLPQVCQSGPIDKESGKIDCLNCHNAHMGRDRFFLTRDYKEVKIPAGPIPPPVNPNNQSSFPKG